MTALSRGHGIVERLRKAKKDFGLNYPKKFGGAAAIEILRDELKREEITTSERDVYIREIPCEIDLIIPRTNAKPWLNLLYEPREVAVALEVKTTGSFGESGRDKIKSDFVQLRDAGVERAYVTFEDRKTYKWLPRECFIDAKCFALAWHVKSDGELEPSEVAENWEGFVKFLHESIAVHEINGKRCE